MATEMAWLNTPYATPCAPPYWDQATTEVDTLAAANLVTFQGKGKWQCQIRFIDTLHTNRGFHRRFMAHKRRVKARSFAIVCPQVEGTVGVDGEMYDEDDTHGDALLAVAAKADAGATTVRLKRNSGITDNIALRTGRFIRFDGATHIYMVVDAEDAAFTGVARTVTIEPALREGVAVDEDVHLNPNMTVQLTRDEILSPDDTDGGIEFDKTITFMEVI